MKHYLVLIALLLISTLASSQKLSGIVKGGPTAVILEPVPAKTFPPSNQTGTIDQRGLKFTPPLLVVQQGTTVEFKNSDTVSHNIFWPNVSGNKKLGHNLGTATSGQSQSRGHLDHQLRRAPGRVWLPGRPAAARHRLGETASVDPSHAEIRPAFGHADLVDGDNVNVTVKGDTKLDF